MSKLGDLVKKAKGEDRTLREYARNSEVDAAVISRIISGRYIPKRPDIYKALTSHKAAPRGGVTYKQLIEAADSSRSYQKGIIAGMATTEVLLSTIGGLTIPGVGIASLGIANAIMGMEIHKEKADSGQYNNIVAEIKRFAATASGLIFKELASQGIQFKLTSGEEKQISKYSFDTYLELENQVITDYIFKYAFFTDEHQNNDDIVDNIARSKIAELVFYKPSEKRKVSIVTNCKKAYNYILSYKNNISYNGELSVILIDLKDVKLVAEESITHFRNESSPDRIMLIKK